jgi:hypothetical protein
VVAIYPYWENSLLEPERAIVNILHQIVENPVSMSKIEGLADAPHLENDDAPTG